MVQAHSCPVERNTDSVVLVRISAYMAYGGSAVLGLLRKNVSLSYPILGNTSSNLGNQDLAAVFQISDKAIEAIKSSTVAFATMLEKQFSDAKTDAKITLAVSTW